MASFPGVWALLDMDHDDRNSFLRKMGEEEIPDECVRNVNELIYAVQNTWDPS